MQAAIAQQAQPPCVGRDVAADVTRALGAQVERDCKAGTGNGVVQGLQHAACLGYEHAADLREVPR